MNLVDSDLKCNVHIDESACKSFKYGLYHNRVPSSRPKTVGLKVRACKTLNIWTGISYFGHIKPAETFIKLKLKKY